MKTEWFDGFHVITAQKKSHSLIKLEIKPEKRNENTGSLIPTFLYALFHTLPVFLF